MTTEPILLKGKSKICLTARQAEVLERLAQRKTLKTIAAELGLSEATVNFHVRALKDAFDANSLSELAQIYAKKSESKSTIAYRKPSTIKYPVGTGTGEAVALAAKDAGPVLQFRDSMSYAAPAPWDSNVEPVVVPGVLNGANSKWVRTALIVGITVGLFAAVLIGLGVAQGVSAVFRDGRNDPAVQ